MDLRHIFLRELLAVRRNSNASFLPSARLTRCERKSRTESGRPRRCRQAIIALLLPVLGVCLSLTGCTGSVNANASAGSGGLQASPGSVSFGTVSVGQSASSSVSLTNQSSAALQITNAAVSGQAF